MSDIFYRVLRELTLLLINSLPLNKNGYNIEQLTSSFINGVYSAILSSDRTETRSIVATHPRGYEVTELERGRGQVIAARRYKVCYYNHLPLYLYWVSL